MVVMDNMRKDYEMSTSLEHKIIPCKDEFPVHQPRERLMEAVRCINHLSVI